VEDDEAENEDREIKTCRIAVAFGLSPVETKTGAKEKKGGGAGDTTLQWELVPMEPGRVCIYFPADKETSNLRFHLHAPFASTVARDSVRDCVGNNVLRDNLTELLAESMPTIRDQGLLTVRALAVLPNDKDNLPEFYKPLMQRLIEAFQEQDLVPMKQGGHATAWGLLRGAKALSDLIDDADIVTLFEIGHATPMWAANPPQRNQREDNFLSMLEIKEWTDDDLVSTLSKIDDTLRAEWMAGKSDVWHQRLYAHLEDHADKLEGVEIVRVNDGRYRRGSDCFFPTEEIEQDDRFPRVAKGVYRSGKDANKKAREFLEKVGVREVDEQVEIEGILKAYYAHDSKRPNRKDHYSHLRRFMRFLSENPEQTGLFEGAYLFMVEGKEDHKWMMPARVYLDEPYMDTKLRTYFELRDGMYPLSAAYEKSNLKSEEICEFARILGAVKELPIEETKVTKHHPEWIELSRRGGDRWTEYFTNEDYHIPCLAQFLASPSMQKSRLVWRTMKESCRGYWYEYLKARFGRNASNIASAKSTLVHDLMKAEWVPQKHADRIDFVCPRDAVAENLPEGFEYQTGWKWLQELEFGQGVEARREEQRREQERQTTEYKRKEQVLKEVGFDSPEEAEEMVRLKREDPEGFQRWRESQQAKPAFPERTPSKGLSKNSLDIYVHFCYNYCMGH